MVQQGEKRGRYKRHTTRVGKSGFRGVYLSNGKYIAQLALKGAGNKIVNFYLGRYDTALEASKARIKFINKLK